MPLKQKKKNRRQSITAVRQLPAWPVVVAVIAMAIIGVLMVAMSGAATHAVQSEAEAGNKTGKAADVSDAAASGGQAVRFGSSEPSPGSCSGTPGAGAGATAKGETEYAGSGTTTVRNVIFDGSHDDDLVRVYNGKVIFENVTFRGKGTSDSGHSLEIKVGGSAEVRNSVFEGAPTEDFIQTQNNGPTLIECNVFKTKPGEDDIDMKSGASVTVRNNEVQAVASSGDTFIMQNSTSPVIIQDNLGVASIFFTNGAKGGKVINNKVNKGDSTLWVYDVSNILIQGNDVGVVKNGENGTGRSPSGIYYLNNKIGSFQFNGGSCFKSGNTSASITGCSEGAPAWYTP
jgi:hypothetical protein